MKTRVIEYKTFPADGKNIFCYQAEPHLTAEQKERIEKKSLEQGFIAYFYDYAVSTIIELKRRF